MICSPFKFGRLELPSHFNGNTLSKLANLNALGPAKQHWATHCGIKMALGTLTYVAVTSRPIPTHSWIQQTISSKRNIHAQSKEVCYSALSRSSSSDSLSESCNRYSSKRLNNTGGPGAKPPA